VSTRRYEQRVRADQAARTRQRILEAVIERLRAAPTEPVAVERIGAIAGVARSTVYAIFGSRAGLFNAVGAYIFERAGYRELVDAARRPDARGSLRAGIRAATAIFAGDRDVVRVLYSMAQLDEQAVGGAVGRWEAERGAGMARLARRLRDEGELRAGVSAEQAEHTLWMLTSFESFDLLFTGRRLPADHVATLLIAAAERSVCAERPSG